MADTLKQIYDGTLTFGNYVNKKQTLVTGNATTQYVIKDVRVTSNLYNTTPELLVNGSLVAALGGTGSSLSGSEIVDINNNIEIKTSQVCYLVNAGSSSTTSYSSGFVDNYDGFPALSSTTKTAATGVAITVALTGTPNVGWMIGGNFYYWVGDGNSTSALYKRTGGINGTQTTLVDASYTTIAFDGVSKFYWVNVVGYYFTYNTTTGVTSQNVYNSAIIAATSYPTLTFCAGYLIYQHTYYGAAVPTIVIDVATGIATTLSIIGGVGGNTTYSSNTETFAFNDSINKVIRIIYAASGVSNTGYYIDISYSAVTPTLKTTLTSITYSASYYGLHSPYSSTEYNIFPTAVLGELAVLDKDMKVMSKKTVVGANFTTSRFPIISYNLSPTTGELNTHGPTISLRITGIQSTI